LPAIQKRAKVRARRKEAEECADGTHRTTDNMR
jgi:hypothetical protein